MEGPTKRDLADRSPPTIFVQGHNRPSEINWPEQAGTKGDYPEVENMGVCEEVHQPRGRITVWKVTLRIYKFVQVYNIHHLNFVSSHNSLPYPKQYLQDRILHSAPEKPYPHHALRRKKGFRGKQEQQRVCYSNSTAVLADNKSCLHGERTEGRCGMGPANLRNHRRAGKKL